MTVFYGESVLLNLMNCFLLKRQSENQINGVPLMPEWLSFWIGFLWFTVSNALLNSIKTPTENYFLSIEFEGYQLNPILP